jgi:regulator of sirC expression with transglutaminase-like and TPR domain
MRRRELLLAAAACACTRAEPQRPFFEAALAVARDAGALDATAERFCRRELERLTELARASLSRRGSATAGLRALVFEDRGFVREVDDTDLRFVLLPGVLRDRRGSCVGLGSLYLALTEALGLAAHGVLRPGHFYVRLQQGGAHTNVELLRRGEAMPDAWYEGRFPAPEGAKREYGRPLTASEAVGVIDYNVGNQRRREHRIEAARSFYARAVQRFPDFAEAHAGLGAALHLLGRAEEARKSYDEARRLNPRLENLERNLSLLELEKPR